MTAKSAVMTTTRSRLITASSAASIGTVLTFHPIMFAEFGICSAPPAPSEVTRQAML
jgi:hypothetical protein